MCIKSRQRDTEQADGLGETERKRKFNAIPDKSNLLDNYSCQSHSIIRLCASMFVALNNNESLLKWNNLFFSTADCICDSMAAQEK